MQSASGRRHDTIVDTVCAVSGLIPGIPIQVIRGAVFVDRHGAGGQLGRDRACRRRGVDSRGGGRRGSGRTGGVTGRIGSRGIGAAGGNPGVVGARCGSVGIGRGLGRADGHPDQGARGGGLSGGPAPAVVATGTVVIHRGGRMVRRMIHRIGRAVIGTVVGGRAVAGRGGRALSIGVFRAPSVGIGNGRGVGALFVSGRVAVAIGGGRSLSVGMCRAAAVGIAERGFAGSLLVGCRAAVAARGGRALPVAVGLAAAPSRCPCRGTGAVGMRRATAPAVRMRPGRSRSG